jgi:hypothetical protein
VEAVLDDARSKNSFFEGTGKNQNQKPRKALMHLKEAYFLS